MIKYGRAIPIQLQKEYKRHSKYFTQKLSPSSCRKGGKSDIPYVHTSWNGCERFALPNHHPTISFTLLPPYIHTKGNSWRRHVIFAKLSPGDSSPPLPNFCPNPLFLPPTQPSEHRHEVLTFVEHFVEHEILTSFIELFCFYSYLGFQLFHLLKPSFI